MPDHRVGDEAQGFHDPERSDTAESAESFGIMKGGEIKAGDQVSRARAALAAATADARARGVRPERPERTGAATTGAATTGASGDARSGDGASGGPVPGMSAPGTTRAAGRRGIRSTARPGFAALPQHADPQQLGAAIDGLLNAEGWTLAAATGSVFGRWAQIVGADLAAHTTPESLADGELTVSADSTAWATQVRLLAAQLVRRLNSELGDGTVLRVKVRGPVTSTRKPGEWRVRGGRGPRDTYG
jgi:predicted nucleic acid-binding Zn ribbon protein